MAYKGPKGYDREEMDLYELTKLLEGHRLVYAMSKSSSAGSACLNTLRNHASMPPFQSMAAEIDMSKMKANFRNYVFSDDEVLGLGLEDKERSLYVLMLDDVKGETRARIDERDGMVRGLCYHAVKNHVGLEMNSFDDCISIRNALENGNVHYATEFTHVTIGAIREKGYGIKMWLPY